MSLPPTFVKDFQRESWSLYGSGVAVICFRMAAQIWRQGYLRIDDYLMIFAGGWYTLLCVALNKFVGGGGSNFMSDADIAALTPETTKERIEGAKWVFVSEQALMATVWTMKGCMLIVYARLTEGLKQRQWINWLAIYTYVGYGITQICYFTMCRPFTDYFVVPPPPGQDQCASYFNVLIVQGCFNITSDVGVLLVGIPLLLFIQVPVQQKIGIVAVFGMGVFVIVAAILNKVYSTVPSLLNDSINYTWWYMRETTVGVYVINLPTLWPVLRKLLPILTGRGSSAANSYGGTGSKQPSRSWMASNKRTQISSNVNDDAFEMKSKRGKEDADSEDGSAAQVGAGYFSTSQEHIIENGNGNGKQGFTNDTSVLEINHDVTFTVEHSRESEQRLEGYHANVHTGYKS
ncbi:hypothetical protein B0O99DRAFT_688006 [Bisporella sp. PMI_857]|nr:hypothetical protein B0O99DRAFT_688006 [Bisporella sp. PMI_857]